MYLILNTTLTQVTKYKLHSINVIKIIIYSVNYLLRHQHRVQHKHTNINCTII